MERIVYKKNYNAPKINKQEALRYSGSLASDEALALLDSCIDETRDILSYNVCCCRFPISISGNEIDLGFASVRSHSLSICLNGCHEIIVFCATVGVGIDRLIKKYSSLSPSRAVMLHALGSERVEALCDAFCDDILAAEREVGRTVRPRFSPGYGDLSLEVQGEIFKALDPGKMIGVSLNSSLLMTPEKSVSAIIGIKEDK